MKLFTNLDANSGFWQIALSPASCLLTTFITPTERFCFNKLPFGIASAPELFQKPMSNILTGISEVACQMDDILEYGSYTAEHDTQIFAVLNRIESLGITLNPNKCEFVKSCIKFLVTSLTKHGLSQTQKKHQSFAI